MEPVTVSEAKLCARERSRAALRDTLPEERAAWSAAIRRSLVENEWFRNADTVMLFAAMRYEPDFLPLLTDPRVDGKRLLFPRMGVVEGMTAHLVGVPGELEEGEFCFRAPAARCPEVPADGIDLIVVPGLAFTRSGIRLGRGKGHYDRFLANSGRSPRLAGACFGVQIAAGLPAEPRDISMEAVITEDGWHAVG